MKDTVDLAVLGGGPGGYVAAIRASQLKKKVVLIEREALGGVCMNWGCIPTKYLLEQTKFLSDIKKNKNLTGSLTDIHLDWKQVQEGKNKIVERLVRGVEYLLNKNHVKVIKGKAHFKGQGEIAVEMEDESVNLTARNVILAYGSRPAELPFLKPNGKEIITSRDALELEEIPEEMVVVGAGAVGLEMAVIFHRLGCRVTVLEMMPVIVPGADEELSARLLQLLTRQGIKIHTRIMIQECHFEEGTVTLKGENTEDKQPVSFASKKVLLAIGRRPNSEDLKELSPQIDLDKSGFVRVDEQLQTGIQGVYAIGDLIGGMLLAHKASHEGIVAAENACGLDSRMDYEALPNAIFTEPELASVGWTQQQAQEKGIKIFTGSFPLQASGRALTMGKTEGFVKILADENNRIRGAHILSPGASELIAELVLAVRHQLSLEDVSRSIHIHPTLTEAVMEAALKAQNEAIHILNDELKGGR